MVMKILNRRLGKVNIIDLFGQLVGQDAFVISKELDKSVGSKNADSSALFNLGGVSQLDLGVCQTILEEAKKFQKVAIVASQKLIPIFALAKRGFQKCPVIFNEMHTAVTFFQNELADNQLLLIENRRSYNRIEIALPVSIAFRATDKSTIKLVMATSNISLTGLLANFVDAEAEEMVNFHVSPYELQMLPIHVFLPADQVAVFDGKVVQYHKSEHCVSFDFYGGQESSRALLANFIERKSTGHAKEN